VSTQALGIGLSLATAGWVLAFLLQLVDVRTGYQVRRAGRATGFRDRDRVLAWTVTVCAIVLVALVLGVDFAARLLLDRSELLFGALLLIALAAAGAITALLAARAIRRPQTGYQVIREELRTLAGTRLAKGRLADYRSWFEAVDARQNDLRRHVMLGRWVRTIPPVIAVVAIAMAIWSASSGDIPGWAAVIYLVPFGVSLWLAVWGARISLARNLAVHAVQQKQRAELLLVLDELDRKAPRKVAGLSERVSRALAILREQQGQESRAK
jgi:hypothetical protein